MPETSADLVRLKEEYARRETRLAGSDLYSPNNPAQRFLLEQRSKAVLQLLHQQGLTRLDDCSVLELGCGAGGVLLEYIEYGVKPHRLFGVDLLPTRLQQAKSQNTNLQVAASDGQQLPYPSAQFGLVLQYTVFSSVLDGSVKANLAQELRRVLKPNGLILWYDFWLNPSNPQTKGIRPNEIRQLFPHCAIQLRRITLAPPIARWLIRVSPSLCSLLEKLQIFNSHYLAAIRPNG